MGNSETKESTYGYRIIKVAPNSPAKQAGLVEFLDYIIDISSPNNQIPFSGNYGEFFKIIQNSEDQEATMKVYNILYRKTRIVTIVPSKKWENSDSLLGALVRYEEYASAYERVLRVANVHENSPASAAGLVPDTDYLLGSPQYLYTDLNELASFIEMTQEKETIKSLELYVYSSATNSVRSTLIMPNKNWGGQGQLGCEFALGFLNHLPQLEDNVHVSNFEEEEKVDRLDTDSDKKSGSEPRSQNSLNEIKLAQDHTEQQQEGSNPIKTNEPEQPEPEKKADVVTEVRPPTAAELHQAHPPTHDHAHDDHRAKLLHLAHQHKISVKSIAKPFIKPGNSTANPFHNPEHAEEASQVNQTAASTNETQAESNDNDSVLAKAREELRMAEKKISQHIEALKETAVASGQAEEQPKHAAPVRSPSDVDQDLVVKDVNREVVENNQEQEVRKSKEELRGENEEKAAVVQGNGVTGEVEGRNEEGSVQEKQVCKTTIEYNFFSKKLNKDYRIESVDLFNVEELERLR